MERGRAIGSFVFQKERRPEAGPPPERRKHGSKTLGKEMNAENEPTACGFQSNKSGKVDHLRRGCATGATPYAPGTGSASAERTQPRFDACPSVFQERRQRQLLAQMRGVLAIRREAGTVRGNLEEDVAGNTEVE